MTLVLVYGAVLEKQGAQGGMLCPESVLPAPKETIRAALRLMAMYHIVTGDLDEPVETSGVHGRQTWRNALSVGYMALASFVPDAISARESDWRAFVQEFDSMNTEQQNERLLKGDLYIPTEDYDKSTSEAKRLLEEFSEFLRRLEELQAKKASSPQPV
jgi:hypothetical protein